MSAELLAELKKLQHQRGDSSPFASHIEFLRWSDGVYPRLSFDKATSNRFKSAVSTAKGDVSFGVSSAKAINEAIGVLNQAVSLLETQQLLQPKPQSESSGDLEPPQKVTVKWLFNHVPVSLVLWALTIICSSFGLGVAFSETTLYKSLKTTAAQNNTTPTTQEKIQNKTVPAKTSSTVPPSK